MTKAYSYVRFSSAAQGVDGRDSERRQDASSVRYAAKHGLELVKSYKDLGVSGWKGRNHKEGALGQFLDAVDDGLIQPGSFLLIEAFDRLTREKVMDALELFLRITKAEITIVTLFDGASYSRENIEADWTKLIIALAQFAGGNKDVTIKSERLLASWENRRANAATKRTTTVGPAWVKPNAAGKFDLVPDRVALVERIFVELADQNIGAAKIASRLNAEGIRSWGPAKKKTKARPSWHGSMIKKLVGQRAVLGEFQPHRIENGLRVPDGPTIPFYYPPAIDTDLYHRAQAAFAHRRNTGAGRKGKSFSNLLTGLVHCYECGGPMVYVNKGSAPKGGQYLVCSNARRSYRCDAKTHHPYQAVEDRFLSLVANDMELPSQRADNNKLNAQIAEAKHALAAIVRRVDRLEEELLDAETPSQTMRDKLRLTEKNRNELQAKLDWLEEELVVLMAKPAPNAQQESVRAFLDELKTASDLYAVRSRLAGVIKTIVDDVNLEPNGVVTVIIMAGAKAYRWDDAGWSMVNLTPMVVAGQLPMEAYAQHKSERERQITRLAWR